MIFQHTILSIYFQRNSFAIIGKYIQLSANHSKSGVQGSMAWTDYLLNKYKYKYRSANKYKYNPNNVV